mgnify:CR=1 FL=1
MKTYRNVTLILAAITLGLFLDALAEKFQRNRIDASIAKANRETASLRQQIEQVKRQVAASSTGASPKPIAASRGSQEIHPGSSAQTAFETPEAQILRSRRIRADINLRYRAVFAKLGWSPDQIERWDEAIVGYSENKDDVVAAAGNHGLPTANPGIKQMVASEQHQLRDQLIAQVGADEYAKFVQLDRAQAARDFVSHVAGRVFASGAPLTAAQGEALTQIIADASPEYQQGKRVILATVDWNAAALRAQPLLSVGQFAQAQGEQEELETRSNLQRLVSSLPPSP